MERVAMERSTLFFVVMWVALSTANAFAAGESSIWEKENWMFRLRAIDVSPDESSTTSIGGYATAESQAVPEFDITYFFNDNLAAELILATSPHDMGTVGTALGNVDLGEVWILPPTLTLQYHFRPEETFRPYAGAGINYTIFYNEDPGALAGISYEDGFGYALQTGFDYGIDEHWAFNMDVKKVWLNTDVVMSTGAATATADVDLDPWIFGVGVAYRF